MNFFGSKKQEPIEISPKDATKELIAELHKQPFTRKVFPNKIECRVWLLGKGKQRDKLIGKKKVKVGARHFTLKGMRYYIDYQNLKEGEKGYIYDIDVLNSVGGLSFYERQENVDSKQAETMLQDGAVDFFIKKGGIPFWYLLIAIIGMMAMAGLAVYVVPDYMHLRDVAENLLAQNAQLKAQISQLQTHSVPTVNTH